LSADWVQIITILSSEAEANLFWEDGNIFFSIFELRHAISFTVNVWPESVASSVYDVFSEGKEEEEVFSKFFRCIRIKESTPPVAILTKKLKNKSVIKLNTLLLHYFFPKPRM
jgi:hypothetical protein